MQGFGFTNFKSLEKMSDFAVLHASRLTSNTKLWNKQTNKYDSYTNYDYLFHFNSENDMLYQHNILNHIIIHNNRQNAQWDLGIW